MKWMSTAYPQVVPCSHLFSISWWALIPAIQNGIRQKGLPFWWSTKYSVSFSIYHILDCIERNINDERHAHSKEKNITADRYNYDRMAFERKFEWMWNIQAAGIDRSQPITFQKFHSNRFNTNEPNMFDLWSHVTPKLQTPKTMNRKSK